MPRRLARIVLAVLHGGVALLVAAALQPALGTPAALLAGALALLATRPAYRVAEIRLRSVDPALTRALDALASADHAPAAAADELLSVLHCESVGLDLLQPHGRVTLAESARSVPRDEEEFPVAHGGRPIGALRIGTAGRPLREPERAIAAEVARRAGPLLEAALARQVLEAERGRRAAARRRLRHDLHDRVGPSLAALRLAAGARRPSAAALAAQADDAVAELRDVLDGRPPAAVGRDGLVAALELVAVRLAAGGVEFTVFASGRMADLPPAVSEAAFGIAAEAMTNVVRHAAATRCEIRLSVAGDLHLLVVDDGRGRAEDAEPQIGLRSMRERAERAGGRMAISSAPAAGTRVEASLPLS